MQKLRLILFTFLLFFAAGSLYSQSDSIKNTFVKDQYYNKLITIKSDIPIFYNNSVRLEILDLLKNQGHKTSQLIGKINFALNNLGLHFDSLGLPRELVLIAVVNSELNSNHIESSTGASGIWPLTYSTAKRYRLITNSYIDQRRNTELATKVAAKYIYDLEHIYQDWHFVISAFYAGPINLNMAIRKAGNSLEYPLVHESLELNQRQCLEKFMALWYVYNFHSEHKISETAFTIPQSDTVCTSVALSLDYIADKLEVKKSIIATLNPDFIEGIVPEIENCKCFKIPSNKVEFYRTNRDSIEVKATEQDTSTPVTVIPNQNIKTPTGVPVNSNTSHSKKLIYYTVKSGDNLGLLSKLFDCSINDLKRWNNIKGTMLYAGAKIKVYVAEDKIAEYKKINTMSSAQKQALARRK